MNDFNKTLAFVVAAIVLSGTALVASIPRSYSPEEFNDQGSPFFPDFSDPAVCTSLEVVEVDPETALPHRFKVMLKDNRWIIPSHYDYPADAKDRLARTAGKVIGLTKDSVRSTRSEDHKDLGVVDPLSAKLSSIDGVGKRITLRDKTDQILADYIIGKPVKDHPDQKYVRRPDQVRTYGVKLAAEPSARFADWIETNLLKLDATKLRALNIDTTKVDAQMRVKQGENLAITRKDTAAPWTTAGLEPSEELDSTKTGAMSTSLADLKIVGVRPKPEGLSAELKAAGGEKGYRIDRSAMESLARKGYYFDPQGTLYSDEGGLAATTDDGVDYLLKFGGVTFAQDEALSAGADDASPEPKKSDDKTPEKGKKGPNEVESRFLFVTVQYRPERIAKPDSMQPEAESELPRDLFQRSPEEIKTKADKAEREKTEYLAKLEAGKTRAADLSARFAPWYYVVPGDAFRTLMVDRKSLVKDKTAAPPRGGLPPGMFPPGMGGGGDADPFKNFGPPPGGPR